MRYGWRTCVVSLLACLVAGSAAAGVDGEVELRYWGSESYFFGSGRLPDQNVTENAPGAGLRAEIVLIERLAIAGEYSQLKGDGSLDGFDFTQYDIDVKWRIFAPKKNTFFALGLGYEKFEAKDDNGGKAGSDGLRVVADGRFEFLGFLYAYGRLAYLPSLSDLTFDDEFLYARGETGYDFEIGLGIEPIPILSLWVGYRAEQFDFSNQRGFAGNLSIENSGPFVGAGVHF